MAENVVSISSAKSVPGIENGKVLPPRRKKNSELRSREYLTEPEVEQLMKAAKHAGRYGHRDSTLILIAYRHALRVTELISMRWDNVDLEQGLLHITRLKNGVPSTHPLSGIEIRALRQLKRNYNYSPYLFVTERKSPITTSTVRKIIARAGRKAEFCFSTHPHMLRHSTGFKLANDGQDTRSIQHTVRYTELRSNRFNGFWKN